MKWFYKLKSTYRIIIAVAAWLPLVMLAGIMGGTADELSTPVTIVGVILLALGIVFTVFAVKASNKESTERKRIINEKAATDNGLQAEERAKARVEYDARESKARTEHNAERQSFYAATTKIENIKLSGNKNENIQSAISSCSIGDEVEFEYDDDKERYLASSGYDIGVLPPKYIGIIEKEKYKAFIENIDLDENDNYVVNVDILIFDSATKRIVKNSAISINNFREMPINTKIVGVTFENRQEYLAICNDGDIITVKHAPSIEYPDSVTVTHDVSGNVLGHIKSELAKELLVNYGNGCNFKGKITAVTGGDDFNYGCNITFDKE